jgi:hypothetical protein
MPRKPKSRPRALTPDVEMLVKAARAVVRAHHLRDRDEADDGDVGDAIAELEDRLPQRRRLKEGKL